MIDNLIDVLDSIRVKPHGRFLLFLIRIITVHEVGGALDPSICELTYFLAVIAIPSPAIELLMEF